MRQGKTTFPELLKISRQEPQWELYNMEEDFNEQKNLASVHPQKVAELKALFDRQAEENNLYPLLNWAHIFGMFINAQLDREDVDRIVK
jgi:arylsulfatase A-like enzyme